MTPAEQVKNIQLEVESLQRDLSRIEGAEEELMKRLLSEHECESIKKAKSLIDKMTKELKIKEIEFQKSLEEYNAQRSQVSED